jgi:hypothetical protein
MNGWDILKLRESLLRDLDQFIEADYYGTLASHDHRSHELDFRLGKKLSFSSTYPKMTIRQRRASELLQHLGLCGATEYTTGTVDDEDQLKNRTESLIKMNSDLADLIRDYGECLSEDERKLLLRPAENDQDLDKSERTGLLRLVIAMAIGGYQYDPSAPKDSVVSEIRKDLDELGISLSDQTVRKYLIQAAAKFPHARKAKH